MTKPKTGSKPKSDSNPENDAVPSNVNASGVYTEEELAKLLGYTHTRSFKSFSDDSGFVYARTPKGKRVYSGRQFVLQVEHLAIQQHLLEGIEKHGAPEE